MRIVFFSHYYPPEVNAPASRTSEHCRVWAKAGQDVTVVTCAPNHPRGELYPGYKNKLWQRETLDGVKVIRLWTSIAANSGFLRRTLNYLSYFAAATLALPFLPKADVVVSTSPQFFCGLVGLFARPLKRAPWVLEIRDLWPESIAAVGAMERGLGFRAVEALERLAYRRADAIVPVTRSFVAHIAERRGTGDGIEVIRNGADLATFCRTDAGADYRRQLGLDGKFVATYVGTLGMAHGLRTLLDAAESLKGDPRFAFVLAGDGADRANLEAERISRRLENVHILGQRPKSEMPALWSASDAAVVLLKNTEAFKKVLPSKMMEAMAMERPIVLGVDGEARELLEEAGAGIAIPPEDAKALADALVRLANDRAEAAAFGSRGRAYVTENLDRAKLAARYLQLLEDVADRAKRPTQGLVKRGQPAE